MYCHDILALDAIVHSASLSLCLDSSSSSSSQTHTTHSMSVDAPFLKVLKFARVCNGMREKRLPSQWATEECMKRMHQQLVSTWSLHFPFTPDQVHPPRPASSSFWLEFFYFFFVLHPLPWCRGPRRPLPTFVIPIRPGCACQGGGTAATGK